MGCCGTKGAKIAPSPDGPEAANASTARGASGRRRRPALQELRALNQPGPMELGGDTPAFGKDATNNAVLRSGASCLKIIEKNAVLVAVRVRPLNSREQGMGSAECVKWHGPTSISMRTGSERNFAFDCVLRQDASQRDVFDRTARPLLHKVLEGYNGCIFAYGQTGSGKTFTMQGELSGDKMGVIPLVSTELFHEISSRSLTKTICATCSLMEIYNEQLHDLLIENRASRGDLQILEDPTPGGRGMYVDGISEHKVESCEAILKLLAQGQARRAVGQTNMNEHSSRSHAVLTILVSICDCGDTDGSTIVTSKLHLIDLAGSERQKSTGATGDRLKEGAQINLSLSALGNVISALTESGSKRRHVPYRDSKLTRLLQDSLGGNAYTVMICNVSPAVINAEETLSVLRFAERAKKIENVATINRDPKCAKIAELLQANAALHAKVNRLEAHIVRLEENYT